MVRFGGLCIAVSAAVIALSGCQTGNGNGAVSPLQDDDQPRFYFNASKSTDEQIADLNVCYSARNEAETEGAGYAAGGFLLGGIAGAIVASNIHDDQVQSEFTQCLSGRGYSAVIVPERLDWAAFGMETDEGRAEAIQAFNRTLSDAERQSWIEVSAQHSTSSYGGFLQTYPDSVLAQEAVYRLNRLIQVANIRHEEALWEGSADGRTLQDAASSDGSTATGVGPKVWRGQAIGDGARVEYGWLFCKDSKPHQMTMKIQGDSFHGEIRRNRDGRPVRFEGSILGENLSGKYKGPDSEISLNITGIREQSRIVGSFFSPALPACNATYTLKPYL